MKQETKAEPDFFSRFEEKVYPVEHGIWNEKDEAENIRNKEAEKMGVGKDKVAKGSSRSAAL